MEVGSVFESFDGMRHRLDQLELLDLGQGTDHDVAVNLAEMERINRLLGGTPALTRYLYPRLKLHHQLVTLLDVGTGAGALPLELLRWAAKQRLPLRVLAADLSGRNLRAANTTVRDSPKIQRVQADALSLPLPAGQVDYVVSTLFLHHLTPEQLEQLLVESFRLANRAVMMSDLIRGWMPYLAFKLIQPVFARNYLTRKDGALSIRRAYTPEELYRIAVRAGLPDPRIYVHFPWRMTLVVEK